MSTRSDRTICRKRQHWSSISTAAASSRGRTDRDRRYCCTIMERLNALVWDVDYCVAPEAPFPAAVEETYGIIAYAFDHAEKLGVDPAKVILAGHSAGGNLVAAACLKNAESHRFSPCCVLMEYFPVDNAASPVERLSPQLRADPFWVKRAETEKLYTDFYVGDADPAQPLCSPLNAADEALATSRIASSSLLERTACGRIRRPLPSGW